MTDSIAEQVWTGGCLCGAVRYSMRGPLRDVLVCHCARCQRLHSHVGAYTACLPKDLTIELTTDLRWYQSSPAARRGFCGRCGAQLFWDPSHGGHISIAAGTLDPPTGLKVAGHICTAQKGDYYEITDGLPQRDS